MIGSLVAPGFATAAANNCQGAPGTSAVEQYCEALLDADGERQRPTAPQATGTGTGAGTTALPAGLRHAGDDGAAIARLVPVGDLPGAPASGAGDQPARPDRDSGVTVQAAGGSALSAARHAVQAGPTASPALAWGLMGATTILSASALITRRRPGEAAS